MAILSQGELCSRKKKIDIFNIVNIILLIGAALICVLPFINIIAMSFSESYMVSAGRVSFWPRQFNLSSYEFVLGRQQFWTGLWISIQRVVIGVFVNMLLVVLCAYPLSRDRKVLRARTFIAWFFFITILFNGGMIPTYLVVVTTGLKNQIWSLILPNAVPVANVLLMINFFRQIPSELDEAAVLDGAGHFRILFGIYVPLSLSSLATLTLFQFVFHWNSWFDGMIYMNNQSMYPLQTYVRNLTTLNIDPTNLSIEEQIALMKVSDRTMRSALIIVASVPVMIVYPFLQRYFVKGLTLGSVKG